MISRLYEDRLRSDIFKLSIVSLVTVVIWVGMATYKVLTKKEIKIEVKNQIKALTPSLDLDTIENIKQRQIVPEEDWGSLKPVIRSVLATPEPASESAELEDEPASESP